MVKQSQTISSFISGGIQVLVHDHAGDLQYVWMNTPNNRFEGTNEITSSFAGVVT